MTLYGEAMTLDEKLRLKMFLADHRLFMRKHEAEDPRVFLALKQLIAERLASEPSDKKLFREHAASSNGKIPGLVIGRLSPWDSGELGLEIAKIDHLLFNENEPNQHEVRILLLQKLIRWTEGLNVDCVFVRASLDDYATIAALEQLGFRTADALITFRLALPRQRTMDQSDLSSEGFRLKGCAIEDIEEVATLSGQIFRADHYHNDPRIPAERSDHLYASWAKNCCKGRSDEVIIARNSAGVAGFITCNIKEPLESFKYGVIELVGVSVKHRGIGLARRLLERSLDWFTSQEARVVYVGTQAENYAAMNLYASGGFRVVQSEVTMHRWA